MTFYIYESIFWIFCGNYHDYGANVTNVLREASWIFKIIRLIAQTIAISFEKHESYMWTYVASGNSTLKEKITSEIKLKILSSSNYHGQFK